MTYISLSSDFTSNTISRTCISMVWANTLGDLILIVDQCDIFHGTVILHRISNTFIWICIIIGLIV